MRKISSFLLLSILVQGAVFSQNISTISVVTEEWEDCTMADGSGLYFDILREVYQPEGARLDIRIMPYSRAVDSVAAKRADIVIGTYADEVEGVIYPEYHFDSDNVSALYLKSRYPSFQGEEDLSGRTVAWIRGYGYDEYIDQKMKVVELDKRELAISMLLARRIDYFLDARADIEAALEGVSSAEAGKLALAPVQEMKLFMCFADTPKGRKLAELWDSGFRKLIDSGKLDSLFTSWDAGSYTP